MIYIILMPAGIWENRVENITPPPRRDCRGTKVPLLGIHRAPLSWPPSAFRATSQFAEFGELGVSPPDMGVRQPAHPGSRLRRQGAGARIVLIRAWPFISPALKCPGRPVRWAVALEDTRPAVSPLRQRRGRGSLKRQHGQGFALP